MLSYQSVRNKRFLLCSSSLKPIHRGFDLLKTVQSKRCLAIDEVAMKNVLLPLIYKFNLPGVNLAAFKDEISPEALLLFFANVPTTKIRTILIAKPLNAAKAQIEALIAQRGGSIKVS